VPGESGFDERQRTMKPIRCTPPRHWRTAGIDLAAGGQAIAEHHERYQWIAPQVTLALSGLTTITTLECQGYALMSP
jgi:hypothetical protein